MITGVHITFFTPQADALRAFLRDVVRFPSIDAGGGWLVFDVPEAELGVHPTDVPDDTPITRPGTSFPELSFYCDDIYSTVDELRGRGVQFVGEVTDVGYALSIPFRMPGDVQVQLYQPKYVKDRPS